jgi:uncharacterized membrane protein YdjX (TVP38/TMEM64 family)
MTAPIVPPVSSRDALRATLLAGAIVVLAAAAYWSPLRDMLDPTDLEALHGRIERMGVLAPLGFAAASIAAICIGLPRIAFAAAAGAAFGFAAGAALAQAATMVACLITFLVARRLGRPFVERRIAGRYPRIGALLGVLGRHAISGNVLIRVAPVGNCLAANLLMAITPMTTWEFVAGTFLGTLPETLVYAMFGSSAHGDFVLRMLGGGALLLALTVGCWLYTRNSRLARSPGNGTQGGIS